MYDKSGQARNMTFLQRASQSFHSNHAYKHSGTELERFEDVKEPLLATDNSRFDSSNAENYKETIIYPWRGRCFLFSIFSLSRMIITFAMALHFLTLVTFLIVHATSTNKLYLPVTWSQIRGVEILPATNPATYTYLYDVTVWVNEFPVIIYISIFALLSALEHGFQLLTYRTFWIPTQIGRRRNWIKWAFYSLSAPWMATAILHMTGVTEFVGLASVWTLTSCIMLFGYALECAHDKYQQRIIFFFGCVPLLSSWVLIFYALLRLDNVPAFVTAVVFQQFVMFSSFGVNMLWYLFGGYRPTEADLDKYPSLASARSDNTKLEQVIEVMRYARYTAIDVGLSFIAKFSLAAIVFFGATRSVGPIAYPVHP